MTQSEKARIRAVIDERNRAVKDHNAARAIVMFASEVTAFELGPPLELQGPAARNEGAMEAWFRTWQGPIEIDTHGLKIEASDDIAVAYGLNRMRGTRADGGAVDLWFRSTVCFRKIGGEWKIIHNHSSVPFYMDGSNKAALDLKP